MTTDNGTYPRLVPAPAVAPFLVDNHYLGPSKRGEAWSDELGVIVLAKPTSRRLPQDGTWLELVRWCLIPGKNNGSRQWARVVRYLRHQRPEVTTVVSYSDPSVGHDGTLYRASNWEWAPTWHRLRPPPSGLGSWDGITRQAVKDRWVYCFRRDPRRGELLKVRDSALNPTDEPWRSAHAG